jgi:hypothetical protein
MALALESTQVMLCWQDTSGRAWISHNVELVERKRTESQCFVIIVRSTDVGNYTAPRLATLLRGSGDFARGVQGHYNFVGFSFLLL